MFEPTYLNRWTMPANYFGARWSDYYGSGCGQSRDSDALERSNFECMLQALGGESETVIVVSENHWAVGWVEWIAIHETDEKALRIADAIQERLRDYPVINENHWSETEYEEANRVWANCYHPKVRIKYIRKHRDQFDFCGFHDLLACVRGEYFGGCASELLG